MPVLAFTLILILALATAAIGSAAIVTESKGPNGYGWNQSRVDISERITGSSDRMYYDYGYKNIQISGRIENYWATDCGWWYVKSEQTLGVKLYNGTDELIVDTSHTTTKGGWTYTHTWASNNTPGRWKVEVGNASSNQYVVFYIYVRGQLNVTSVETSGNEAGQPITVTATVKDHVGRTINSTHKDNAGVNAYPTVTMYVSGAGWDNESTMSGSGENWQGSFTPPRPGDYYITVKAGDDNNKWLDGRGSTKVNVWGRFPAAALLLPIIIIFLSLLPFIFFRGGGGKFFLFLAVFCVLLFLIPMTAVAANSGNYQPLPSTTEIEINITSCMYDSSGNTRCHLTTSDFPPRGATSDTPGWTSYPYPHPDANRSPAAFYPLFVHRHHGGTNWPHWGYSGTTDGLNIRGNLANPLTGNLQGGYADDTSGMTNTVGGVSDLAIRRNKLEIGHEKSYTTGPYKGDPQGDNYDQYIMATCSWADSRYDFDGCHGITGNGDSYTTDDPRTDTIPCTTCHVNITADTLNHGGQTSCDGCHGTSAGNVLSGNNPVIKNCTDSGCHNTTVLKYGHAGIDCRYCHGHGHNVSGYTYIYTTGTGCGDASNLCHSPDSDKPMGEVMHNKNNESGMGPACKDCHGAHNLTTPKCGDCHNPAASGPAHVAGTGLIPGWDENTSATYYHGNSSAEGGRGNLGGKNCTSCHNDTSYHSNPGNKYPGVGGNSCNNTACHGIGGDGQTINESHYTLECGACHNNGTITARLSTSAYTINTNVHATWSSDMIPLNITTVGYVNSADCKLCHDDSNISDLECNDCHGNQIHSATMNITSDHNNLHTIPNPNCTECHDWGGVAGSHVDVSAMNDTTYSIHADLNNQTDPTLNGSRWENRMCWACHGEDGNNDNVSTYAEQPADRHPANYSVSPNCEDCHRYGYFDSPVRYNHTHYGTINTPAAGYCSDCHMLPEMLMPYFDEEGGSNSTTAHYGTKRLDLRGFIGDGIPGNYCGYCHQNTSTVFPFLYEENKARSFHSPDISTTPECGNASCHRPGDLHSSEIVEPYFTDANCTVSACHPTYNKHNGTVGSPGGLNCTACHMNETQTHIHPIKYLQEDGVTFSVSKITAADCDACHRSTAADDTMIGWGHSPASKVEYHHASAPGNGTRWGDFWNYTPEYVQFATNYTVEYNETLSSYTGNVTGFVNVTSTNLSYAVIGETSLGAFMGDYPENQNFTEGADWPAKYTMMAYGEGTVQTPRYRLWNGTAWSTEQSANSVGGTIYWIVLKAGPTRDEHILGTLDSGEDLNVQVWNGSAWGDASQWTGGVGSAATRGFDIAYEQSSGDAILVYGNSAADPLYRVWNGSGWSDPATVNIETTGEVRWIRMASRPGSDQIALMTLDANNDVYAIIWDGSSWGNGKTLETSAAISTKECIAVEYEQSSGEAMFLWGHTTSDYNYYWVWDGSNWVGASKTQLYNSNQGGDSEWVMLKADPNSNKLMAGFQDAGYDLNTIEWSGSAWGTATEHDGTVENILSRTFDIEYETFAGHEGHAVVVWGDDATYDCASYRHWSGSSWGTATIVRPGTETDDTGVVQLRRTSGDDGQILAGLLNDANNRLEVTRWDGATWTALYTLEPTPSRTSQSMYEPYMAAPMIVSPYAVYPSYKYGWNTSSTDAAVVNAWDSEKGHPVGSIYTQLATQSKTNVTGIWETTFNYTSTSPVAEAKISLDREVTSFKNANTSSTNAFQIDIEKPNGTVVNIYPSTAFTTIDSAWVEVVDYAISGADTAFNESGVYKLRINTTLSTTSGTGPDIKVYYDNVKLHIAEVDYNQYNVTFNTSGVHPIDISQGGNYTLGIAYQADIEPADLLIWNGTAWNKRAYLTATALTNIDILLTEEEYDNGNVLVRYVDNNTGVDTVQDHIQIAYHFVHSDTGKVFPCEYCHASDKHYSDAIGLPNEFKGDNVVNCSITHNSTWCASCHYQHYQSGDHDYDDLVQAAINWGVNIPIEISGNKTYSSWNESTQQYDPASDGTEYIDHDAIGWTSPVMYGDDWCFRCHGGELSSDVGMGKFMHNVYICIYEPTNITVQGHVINGTGTPLNCSITAYDANDTVIDSLADSNTFSFNIPAGGYLLTNASTKENVSAKFRIYNVSTDVEVMLANYGASNPEPDAPPGDTIKYAGVNATNLTYQNAEIKIFYSDAEAGAVNESKLSIYHKSTDWDQLETVVDTTKNILTATTSSLVTTNFSAAAPAVVPGPTIKILIQRETPNLFGDADRFGDGSRLDSIYVGAYDMRVLVQNDGNDTAYNVTYSESYYTSNYDPNTDTISKVLETKEWHFDTIDPQSFELVGYALLPYYRNPTIDTKLVYYNSTGAKFTRLRSDTLSSEYKAIKPDYDISPRRTYVSESTNFTVETAVRYGEGNDTLSLYIPPGWSLTSYAPATWDPTNRTLIWTVNFTEKRVHRFNFYSTPSEPGDYNNFWAAWNDTNIEYLTVVARKELVFTLNYDTSVHRNTDIALTGQVKDVYSGNPVPNATVLARLHYPNGTLLLQVSNNTDANGNYIVTIPGVSDPDLYDLVVTACRDGEHYPKKKWGKLNVGDYYLSTQPDKTGYLPNVNVTVFGILHNVTDISDSIADANVSVKIVLPDGYNEIFNMTTNVDGVYKITFTNTSLEGEYEIEAYTPSTGTMVERTRSKFEVDKNFGFVDVKTDKYVYLVDPLNWNTSYWQPKVNISVYTASQRGYFLPGQNISVKLMYPNGTLVDVDTGVTNAGGKILFNYTLSHASGEQWRLVYLNGTTGETSNVYTIIVNDTDRDISRNATFKVGFWGCDGDFDGDGGSDCHYGNAADTSSAAVGPHGVSPSMENATNPMKVHYQHEPFTTGHWIKGADCDPCHYTRGYVRCVQCHGGGNNSNNDTSVLLFLPEGTTEQMVMNLTNIPYSQGTHINVPAGSIGSGTQCELCHGNLPKVYGETTNQKPACDNTACHPRHDVYLDIVPGSYTSHINDTGDLSHDAANPMECVFCHEPLHNMNVPICAECHILQGAHSERELSCEDCHSDKPGRDILVGNDIVSFAPGSPFYEGAHNVTSPTCYDCHADYNTHGMNKSLNESYTFSDCDSCHRSTKDNKLPYGRLHVPSTYFNCTLCHNSANGFNGTYHSDYANTDPHTGESITGVHCEQCHNAASNITTASLNYAGSVLPENKTYTLPTFLHATTSNVTFSAYKPNCTDCHSNMKKHLNATNAGQKWGNYWDNTVNNSPCRYCHGNDSQHSLTALGHSGDFQGNNAVNSSISSGNWCAGCHYEGYQNGTMTYDDMVTSFQNEAKKVPPEITGNATYAPTSVSGYYDHSSTISEDSSDSKCFSCHGGSLNISVGMDVFVHNVSEGIGGGRDCVSCHDVGGLVEAVNVSAMNMSSSVHNMLNNGTAGLTLNPDNERCWACHGDDNRTEAAQPEDGHPTNYTSPMTCDCCHISPGWTGAMIVYEHYSSGTDIKTNTSLGVNESCVSCHNKTEMLQINNDPAGPKSDYASVSHYGKNRTDLVSGGVTNCSYCHRDTATAFPFVNDANKNISNHTSQATNPDCTNSTCHDADRIHNSTLKKQSPVNHTLCAQCHSGKSRHNNTLGCTECHGNATYKIHPILYLNYDNTTSTSSTNAVNCTSCHQSTAVDGSLTLYPPKVPTSTNLDFNHSDNASAGQIWGNYWNSSIDLTACQYCHNKSVHLANALGNSSSIAYNDTVNSTLDTPSYWCSGCHWQHDEDYSNMTSTFYPAVPPEISNGTYAPNTTPGYYNHSLDDWSDYWCKACHVSGFVCRITEFMHNVAEGVEGGPDCISCHDLDGIATYRVNVSAMNSTDSIHAGLNADADNSTEVPADNKICWGCHSTDGTEPSIHPDKKNCPWRCVDCHTGAGKYNASIVSEHYYNGTDIKTNTSLSSDRSCTSCHHKGEMLIPANDADTGTFDTDGDGNSGGNTNAYHYGKNRSDLSAQVDTDPYCNYCHDNASTVFDFVNSSNKVIFEHTANSTADVKNATLTCNNTKCHGTGRIHNSTLGKPTTSAWTSGKADYCAPCHNSSDATSILNVSAHDPNSFTGIIDCGYCHNSDAQGAGNAYLSIHSDNLTARPTAGAETCAGCHNGTATYVSKVILTHFPEAPSGVYDTFSDTFADWVRIASANNIKISNGNVTLDEKVLFEDDFSGDLGKWGKALGTWSIENGRLYNPDRGYIYTGTGSSWTDYEVVMKLSAFDSPNKLGLRARASDPDANPYNYYVLWTNTSTGSWYIMRNEESITHESVEVELVSVTGDYCVAAGDLLKFKVQGSTLTGYYSIDSGKTWVEVLSATDSTYASGRAAVHHEQYGKKAYFDDFKVKSVTAYTSSGDLTSIITHTTSPITNVTPTWMEDVPTNTALVINISVDEGTTWTTATNSVMINYTPDAANTKLLYKAEFSTTDETVTPVLYDITIAFVPGINVSKANTSIDDYSCEECHGGIGTNKLHSSRLNITYWSCDSCHNGTTAGGMKAWGTPMINVTHHDNASLTGKIDTYGCIWCHNNTNASQPFHYTEYPRGSVDIPGWSWINGTPVKCISCHVDHDTEYPFQAPNVTHSVTGKTLDNCYDCHTNASSYSASSWALHDLYPITLANCVECHSSGKGGTPIVDNATLEAGMHAKLNNTDNINDACKACHQDGVSHYSTPARVCADCHVAPAQFNAQLMYEHHPTGIQVTTTANCTTCHNNSINESYFDATPGMINATVSHYGLNKTGNKLMTADNSSIDCMYCHMNSTNNATWGNAKYLAEHQDADSNDDCWGCHNETAEPLTTFHTENLGPGGGGPDCAMCHDIGGTAKAQVDVSVIAASVHKNLNDEAKNTTVLSTLVNKACWACHGDGTEPSGHPISPINYKNPRTCEDCHVGYVRFNASKVSEHYVSGEDVQAYKPCQTCHKIGYNTYLLEIRFNESVPASEINEKVSHYGEPLHETCRSCHQNNATAEEYGVSTTKMVYKHANNSCTVCHASPRTSVTSLHDENLTIPLQTCKDCHTSQYWMWSYNGPGQIKSHYPGAPSYGGDTRLDGYTCECCHGLSTTQKLHSDSLTVTRWDCVDCHSSTGTGPTARYVTKIDTYAHYESYVGCGDNCHASSQKFHYPTHALGDVVDPGWSGWTFGTAASCLDCHLTHAGEAPFNAPPDHGMTVFNCAECHRSSEADTWIKFVHNVVTVANPDCGRCHESVSAVSSAVSGSVHAGLNVEATNETALTDPAAKACWACHGNGTEPLGHPSEYKAPLNCLDCHVTHGEKTPYNASDISGVPKGQATLEECLVCHGETHMVSAGKRMGPLIKDIILSPSTATQGKRIALNTRIDEYFLTVKKAEYFIDVVGEPGTGIPMNATDGAFNGSKEDVWAAIDTEELSIGNHTIYVHAMDSAGTWGPVSSTTLTVSGETWFDFCLKIWRASIGMLHQAYKQAYEWYYLYTPFIKEAFLNMFEKYL